MKKIKIIIIVPSRVEFLFLQYHLLKLFCLDEFQYIVINDCRDEAHHTNDYDILRAKKIEQMCKLLNVLHIRFPQEYHINRSILFPTTTAIVNEPSTRHADVVQYALQSIVLKQDDIAVFLDSDMFPISPISFDKIIGDAGFASIDQFRQDGDTYINYLWPNLLLVNPSVLPSPHEINVDPGFVKGVLTDTGGNLYHYLTNHPEVPVKYIDNLHSGGLSVKAVESDPFLPESIKSFIMQDPTNYYEGMCYSEFMIEKKIFHFRAGTNWNNLSSSAFQFRSELLQLHLLKLLSDGVP